MLDRTAAPPFVRSTSFNLITPEESTLPNGMTLFFIPGGSQDVLKIELIFEAGKWFEKHNGVAWFTGQLLSRGTKDKNSFQIATIFDQFGAHLEINPGLDFVSVSLYALTKELMPVLDLLKEILTNPTFPENEFRIAQSVFTQNLRVNKEKTSFVASRVFRKNLFGDAHPYGADLEEEDVGALRPEMLRAHFRELFHSAKVFISGKLENNSRRLIIDVLRQLEPGPGHRLIDHAITSVPTHQHIHKQESIQSSIRAGKRSLLRAHEDYITVLFACHVLGGYFGSRLMKNIREEKGLTYGISASLHPLRHDGFLVIGADVNKENVSLAFEEVRKELKRMRTQLIDVGELETSRNHFIGSLQSEITTPFAHAEKIKTITLFNLSQDHYQAMIRRIDGITPLQIAQASERYLHEDSFFHVAVG